MHCQAWGWSFTCWTVVIFNSKWCVDPQHVPLLKTSAVPRDLIAGTHQIFHLTRSKQSSAWSRVFAKVSLKASGFPALQDVNWSGPLQSLWAWSELCIQFFSFFFLQLNKTICGWNNYRNVEDLIPAPKQISLPSWSQELAALVLLKVVRVAQKQR